MTTYFHANMADLLPGNVIRPGRHGRRLISFMMSEGETQFENACEAIRNQYFRNKPSRLNCVFACEDLAGLQLFCSKYPGRHHGYEVEPIEANSPVHRGTWTLTFGGHLHGAVNCSWVYWTQDHQQDVEILIGGPVRIVKKLGP